MRWRGRRKSSNIEDRRGQRPGGGMRLPIGGKGLGGGIGTIVIILVAMYFGVDPSMFLGDGSGSPLGQSSSSQPYQPSAQEQELADLVSVVLADTEET